MLKKKIFSIFYVSMIIAVLGGCGGGLSSNLTSTTGSVSLAWEKPITHTDGTPITDLAGFKVSYGTTPGTYTNIIDVGNVTSYSIQSLSPGTYYFVVQAYYSSHSESNESNEASKTIF